MENKNFYTILNGLCTEIKSTSIADELVKKQRYKVHFPSLKDCEYYNSNIKSSTVKTSPKRKFTGLVPKVKRYKIDYDPEPKLYVEGPHIVLKMTNKELNINAILLGEYHAKTEICTNKDTVSLYDFIRAYSSFNNGKIYVFIEGQEPGHTQDSFMSDLVTKVWPCFTSQRDNKDLVCKKFKNVEFHFADFRTKTQEMRDRTLLIYGLNQMTFGTVDKYMDIFKDIHKIYKPTFDKIKKQINLVLNDKIKAILQKYYDEMIARIDLHFSAFQDFIETMPFHKDNDNVLQIYPILANFATKILDTINYIVDVYTLARFFKYTAATASAASKAVSSAVNSSSSASSQSSVSLQSSAAKTAISSQKASTKTLIYISGSAHTKLSRRILHEIGFTVEYELNNDTGSDYTSCIDIGPLFTREQLQIITSQNLCLYDLNEINYKILDYLLLKGCFLAMFVRQVPNLWPSVLYINDLIWQFNSMSIQFSNKTDTEIMYTNNYWVNSDLIFSPNVQELKDVLPVIYLNQTGSWSIVVKYGKKSLNTKNKDRLFIGNYKTTLLRLFKFMLLDADGNILNRPLFSLSYVSK